MGVFSAGGSTLTATNHDDRRHNLVKFIQQCQMRLTSEEAVCYREVAQLGQPRNRDTPPQVHEKALEIADFHGQTLAVGCTCRQHHAVLHAAEDFINTTVRADASDYVQNWRDETAATGAFVHCEQLLTIAIGYG